MHNLGFDANVNRYDETKNSEISSGVNHICVKRHWKERDGAEI